MAADAVVGRGYTWVNLTDNTTDFLLRTGQGKLHTITANRQPSTGGDVSVYDGVDATGDLIATITIPTATAEFNAPPHTLTYDLEFTTGLFLAVDQTIAGYDFTITYK